MAMSPAPDQLVEGLSDSDADTANRWWSQLGEGEQAELSTLCDPRNDSCKIISKRITILVDSKLLCDDDEADTDYWADFFEYILTPPEIFPPFEPFFRTFYIGCLDPTHAARSILVARSANFACPFDSPVCPYRR
jgi:hypothetical protein